VAFIFLIPPRRTALTLIQRSSIVMKVSNNSGTGRRPSAVKVRRRQTCDKAVKQEIQVWDLHGLCHPLLEAYAFSWWKKQYILRLLYLFIM
jgi:hypothetical protein